MADNKRISVLWFGTGSMTSSLLSAVNHEKMQILAFIDEREEMRGKIFFGLPVIDLPNIADYTFEYILVGARGFERIKEKLADFSIPQDKIQSLDFESGAHEVAIRTASFQACLNSFINSNQPVYGLFNKNDLMQTVWLKRILAFWNSSLTALVSNTHNAQGNEDVVSIAVILTHGVGDAIIALAWLKELYKQAQYKLQIDLFIIQDIKHIFYNQKFINAIYPEELFNDALQYTLKIRIFQFVNIKAYPPAGVEIHPQLLEQINRIAAFEKKHAVFGRYGWITQGAWINFCALRKLNFWEALGESRVIDFSSQSRIGLDLRPAAFSVLERYKLENMPFITLHAGIHADFSPNGVATRIWPHERWNEFCRLFKLAHPEILLVQLGGSHCLAMEGADICLIGQTTQEESAVLLKQAVLHIDGDSGLVHMRRQFSGVSVVLYGPTVAAYCGYAQNINIVSPFCANCALMTPDWNNQCPRGFETAECMAAISAECVFEAVIKHLATLPQFAYCLELITLYSTSKMVVYEPVVHDICKQCGLEQKPISKHIHGEDGIYLHASKQWEYPFALESIVNVGKMGAPLRIADVGGGTGALDWYLAQKGHQVEVFDPDYSNGNADKDINRRFIQSAQKRGYVAEFGSAFNIPEENESFDIVLCVSVVEHLQNKFYALKEMLRVLKPGGKLIVSYDLTLENYNDSIRTEVFTPDAILDELQKFGISCGYTHQRQAVLDSMRDISADKVAGLLAGMTVGGLVITKQPLVSCDK